MAAGTGVTTEDQDYNADAAHAQRVLAALAARACVKSLTSSVWCSEGNACPGVVESNQVERAPLHRPDPWSSSRTARALRPAWTLDGPIAMPLCTDGAIVVDDALESNERALASLEEEQKQL